MIYYSKVLSVFCDVIDVYLALDGSSDNDATDVHYIDDGNNGETSPCLSSEASFFLERGIPIAVSNIPVNHNSGAMRNMPPAAVLSSSRSRELRQPQQYLQRALVSDKFRKPLPLQKNSPRRYCTKTKFWWECKIFFQF